MKKLFYLLFLGLVLTLPIKAYAVIRGELILECDSYTKKIGESISCVLYSNADEGISAVETTLNYDNGLTLSNPVVPSIWQGDYENNSLLLYTDVNKPLKSELLRFNITSSTKGTYSFTFKDTYFSDSSFNRVQIANPNYTFKFISEEESKPNDDAIIAVVVDDKNSTNNDNKYVETEENPGTGAFISISLLVVLSTLSVIIYFKTKRKKLYKL